jgi:hypothetical protein
VGFRSVGNIQRYVQHRQYVDRQVDERTVSTCNILLQPARYATAYVGRELNLKFTQVYQQMIAFVFDCCGLYARKNIRF